MAAQQTLIFTVMPNGRNAQKNGLVSLYLTPRLENGATLAAFPDFLNWAGLVKQYGLKFRIACGGKTATVAADTSLLRPDLWTALFPASTHVAKVTAPAFDKRLIVSYPTRDVLAYMKYAWQSMGAGATSSGGDRSGIARVLDGLSFREGAQSSLASEMSQMRLTLWQQQQAPANTGTGVGVVIAQAPASNLPLPPDGVLSTTTPPFDTTSLHTVATQFALFHHLPSALNSPALPSTPADFAKTLDFHSTLSALSSYPTLLRDLGLVFDVVLPAAALPSSPAASAYLTIGVTQATLGTAWKIKPSFQFPVTQYYQDGVSFTAAPVTSPANLLTANYQPGDIFRGLLALDPSMFNLTQMDVDGGMLKALALADNVVLSPTEAAAEDVLPSLRSSGVALMAGGRALQLLQTIRNNVSFDQALAAGKQSRPFNALDLVRGYRIDIWSSRTGQWHSLHRRDSVYAFGASGSLKVAIQDEEGFVQPATASAAPDPTRQPDPVATANNIPQPDTDLYLHERVSRWDGWSLSATRPGGVMNRSADPSVDTVQDPSMNAPITPFKMQTTFSAHNGTLPPLRFGDLYRLRVRTVDLCGNSAPQTGEPAQVFALPASRLLLPYLRFEPVPPPLVILRTVPKAGGALENLVIRSYNSDPSLDIVPTTNMDDRHIAPPRASERLAEQHGMFDDAQGKLRGDAATYNEIVSRDNYELPKLPGPGGAPIEPGAALAPLYLPDPLARGAALRNLPYTPNNSYGAVDTGGNMEYSTLPDVQALSGSVSWVGFGDEWPSLTSFRLAIVEGDGPPVWDVSEQVLTVSLAKSVTATVDLSSYMTESDLKLMGVWAWLREFIQASEYEAVTNANAWSTVEFASDLAALLTRLVLEGGHEMITPSRTLTLTHAVQQPLGKPWFTQLPVVHQPTQPIFASALRNSFTPITAWRSVGSHTVALLGGLHIHGESSVKIELLARWPEINDDLSQPKPVETWSADHVETLPLATTDAGLIYADSSQSRAVGIYVPQVDTLWFAAPFDELEGVDTPAALAAPIHRLKDTLHRWIGYQAVATSRFQEYFDEPDLIFTRGGETLVVDVPSSARPAAPDVLYVLPTFGWEQQETTTMKSSVRFGSGLRVWLNRPWYSSGDNEMLGIVLWPSAAAAPDYATRELYKPLFTQWGCDPVWKTQELTEAVPSTASFVNAATAAGLSLEETAAQLFDTAAYPVTYDESRQLWFCDIEIESLPVYAPFIRLALARYQSHSIPGVELSRVVLADFAQLAPDRSAVLSIQPSDPRNGRLVVGGLAPEGPLSPTVTISVEQRLSGVESDLAWQAAPSSVVTITEDSPNPSEPDSVLWSGQIAFAQTPPNGQFRVVIREFEQITETPGTDLSGTATGTRLIYAAIFSWNYQ